MQVHGAEPRVAEHFQGNAESQASVAGRAQASSASAQASAQATRAFAEESLEAFVKRLVAEQSMSGMTLEGKKQLAKNYLTSIQAALRESESQVKAMHNRTPEKINERAMKALVKSGKKHFLKQRIMLANLLKKIRVLRRWFTSGYRVSPLSGVWFAKRPMNTSTEKPMTYAETRQESRLYRKSEFDEALLKAQERAEAMARVYSAFIENPEPHLIALKFISKQPFKPSKEIFAAWIKNPGQNSGALAKIEGTRNYAERDRKLKEFLKKAA